VIPALLNGFAENSKSWVFPPALWQSWPHLLGDNELTNLLKARMGGGLSLEGKPVRLGSWCLDQIGPAGDLPQDETAGVHVDPEEGISGEVDGPLQHLRGHVPPCPDLSMGVSNHLTRPELKCQSKVANAGGHVTLDKDVLGLEIPVGDRWFQTLALVGSKLTMQMRQPFRHREADLDQVLNSQDIVLEEVAKASVLVEARHQPKLNLSQIIELLLGEPALLVLEGEDLHCHHLFCNLPFPHCSKPPSSLDLKQLHWPVGQCWCRW